MPVVFRQGGVRYFFYSNEGDPREPVHVHAEKDGAEAKFWLAETVTVAESAGFSRRELAEALRLVEERRRDIEEAWHDHFG